MGEKVGKGGGRGGRREGGGRRGGGEGEKGAGEKGEKGEGGRSDDRLSNRWQNCRRSSRWPAALGTSLKCPLAWAGRRRAGCSSCAWGNSCFGKRDTSKSPQAALPA